MLILQILTYASYAFIIGIYAWRTVNYARMPLHLRWDLYPIPGEKNHAYGGSYYEELEWWKKPQHRSKTRNVIFIIRDYLSFMQYFRQNKKYWLVLYPWHIGFYLIFISHLFFFAGGIALLLSLHISADSSSIPGLFIYYVTLISSVGGCIAGSIGSVGLLIKRLSDKDLRAYSTPMYFFNYIFFLSVFLSGLYSWYFFDSTLSSFREFWKDLITFSSATVDIATGVHVILFSLFLIYMPFTRAMHYIVKYFAFFSVRWDDCPNMKGSNTETELKKSFSKRISWAAPHVQSGQTWAEVISDVPLSDNKRQIK